jgi:DHA1 family bicyclomycin/chloramphenicol resistance-like MFS transporter
MTLSRTPPHFLTLVLLTAFSTLSLNMFVPSLANIAADFEVDYSTVSLSISGYLAVTALLQLGIGPLSDRIGRRPVLLAALAAFFLASVACSLAQDIWTFLFFRMLQGGIATGYALSLAIVRDTKTERNAASLIGYIGMVMAIAPMLAPILGGFIDTALGWRANFYLFAVSGLLLLLVCWVDLGETRSPSQPQKGESSETVLTLVGEPLFWAYSLCNAFSRGSFFIFITGAPLVASSKLNVTTAKLGIYIATITAGFILGSFLSGRFAPRFQPITMMLAGRLVACVGLAVGVAAMLADYRNPIVFFGSTIAVGIGNGLTIPSSSAAAMSVVPGLAGSAAGLSGALVVACGAVLTLMTGFILPLGDAGVTLHLLMLAASATGLAAVFWAMSMRPRRILP